MSTVRNRLLAAMDAKQIFHAPVWGNPRAMTEALRDVRKSLDSADGGKPDGDVLQVSLRRFASTQQVSNFTQLKYVCYGVTVPVGENHWRLIDREPLFDRLLSLVEQHSGQPKQYRRCYQGLLNGYFGFDRQSQTTGSGHANWSKLRAYLGQKLTPIVSATTRRGVKLDWLQALSAHQNLLTEDPCSRYAHDLQGGNTDNLKSLCGALGIASTSWVWDEALMAYVRAVCDGNDRHFQHDMMGVLSLANGQVDIKLAQMLSTRATALTVARYARCTERPEHPQLRDTSLRWIGNPWVNRTAWDAHVQHEPARQMIEGWLKRRLIKDFFELLAHDGGADLRRLNYWLKWEPQISDMWFVLGSDARNNRAEAFESVRKRMVGRKRSLDDSNAQNNAFVMRIGPLLVIEFGVTGNACYAFAAADFKPDLDKPLLGVHLLKQRAGAKRLSHTHAWEPRFDYALGQMLRSVPSTRGALPVIKRPVDAVAQPIVASAAQSPRPTGTASGAPLPWLAMPTTASQASTRPIEAPVRPPSLTEADFTKVRERCVQHGVEWEDNRPKKGAFWVLLPDRKKHPGFAALLDSYGFFYSPGKGFWFKRKD